MNLDAFSQYFSDMQDPRQSAKISYPQFYVLFLTVCVTIAGSEDCEDIEDFGDATSIGSSSVLLTGCRLSVSALKEG